MFKLLRTLLRLLPTGDVDGYALSFFRKSTLVVFLSLLIAQGSFGATETIHTGAFIINMGVTPQTVANGLKPYGLLYDVIKNNDAQVKWIINQTKIKDGTDFTYNSIAYRGGTFIIPVEFRTAAVNAKIAAWQAKGVIGVTTTTPFNVDVTVTLKIAPNWAMDAQNGAIAIKFLQAAEIPATAYYFKTPATLGTCDDLFIMPHADPEWATHGNLYFWNKNSKGGIWAGCHAVSVMEGPDCVNPGNPAQNLKFLTTGGLMDFGDHKNGTVPYSYSNVTDPVYQMMGDEDQAHLNGSEQIYLPLKVGSTWHAGTKIGTYDPTQLDIPLKSNGPAAVVVYGRGFNDPTRGYVMYTGGHDIGGTSADAVSAQREFFNFCFTVATDKAPYGVFSNIPLQVNGGVLYPNFTITPFSPSGATTFTYQWSASIGGVFSAPTSAVTNYTPPVSPSGTPIVITCRLRDGCGRTTTESYYITAYPIPTAPAAFNDTMLFANLCAAQTTTTINVLSNDVDPNNDMSNSVTFMGGGNYGTFTNLGNGNVSYTPSWNFLGTDTMRYRICDTGGLCSFATIKVLTSFSGNCSVWQFQRADSVRANAVSSNGGVTNSAATLGSQDQPNGGSANSGKYGLFTDTLTLQLDSVLYAGDSLYIRAASDNNTCLNFIVQGSNSSTLWTPGANEVIINIPAGTSKIYNDYLFVVNSTTKYINIKPYNFGGCDNKLDIDRVRAIPRQCLSGVPLAVADNITTGQNSSITTNVKINDYDYKGEALTVSIQSNPSHGSVGINGAGNIVYTPTSSYYGSDQFVYRAMNTSCLSDTAIVYVTVTQNPCADTLVGTYHSGNVSSVTSSLNVNNPNFIVGIPDAVNGNNNLTAEINNGVGNNIIVNLGDTVPTGDTIVIRMGSDNNTGTSITVEGNLTNAFVTPPSSSNFTIPGGATKIWVNYNFIVSGPTRYVKIKQTFALTKVDIDAMSWNFWVCSAGPNNPPIAFDDTSSTYSNRPVLTNVVANDLDPDGNSFTPSVISTTNGTAIISSNKILYTPSFGFTGTTTITYKICDSGTPSLCDTAVLTVTVRPGPPVAMKDNTSCNSNSNVTFAVKTNDTLAVSAYIYTTSLYPSILSPSNGTAVLVGNSIKYTPNANFNGRDSLCYMLCDNGSPQQCDTAIMYITVNNQAPVTTNDAATTSACNNATINVVANDVDPEGQGLTITSVTVPTSGTAVISNNQILYTPSSSPVFTGVATFQYTVCDSGYIAQCQTGTVNVTVNMVSPPSNPPVGVDDNDSTYIGQLLFIQVLQNDYDPDNDSLRVDSTAIGLLAPARGTIDYINGNIINYIPTPGQVGIDSFEYKVCDIQHFGGGCINIASSCTIAKVRLVIQNHAPYAADDYYGTTPTTTFNGNASTNDVESDGQGMTYTQLTGPSHATSWTFNSDGTFTYDPNGVYLGDDTASYVVCDGLLCDTGLIIITVAVGNLAPIASNDTINISTVLPHNGNVSLNDIDPNGNINPNGFAVTGGPNTGTFVFNTNGTFTFTAAPGFVGYEYVTYQVCDLGTPSLCGGATLVIEILDAAPFTFNEFNTINEDNGILNVPAGTGILSNSDFDPNGTAITIDTIPMVNASYGVEVVYSDGSYSYTPNADFNGTDFFIVSICDSTHNCTPDTVFITVNPVNDAIVIENDADATNEDVPQTGNIITINDFDPDTTTLVVNTTPVSGPAHGGIVIDNAGNYTYTPSAGFNGVDTIILNVCDGGNPLPASCANDTLIFTVSAVNDPPVMTNENISTNEDTPFSNNAISNDNDPDSTALTVNTTPVVNASHGGFIIAANGNYTYTPAANFNGTDMVVVNVCDAGNPLPIACVNDTIFITVNPVNDAITIVNDTKTTNEDTPVGGTIITAGDFDTDTTAITVNTTPVSGPSHGGFVINAAGAYTYTPAAGFNGIDIIVLNVCDAGTPMPATCKNDTLVITVTAINDPPVMTNENISMNEDNPFSGNATSNDSDPDSTTLTANTTPVTGPSHGGFVIAANGAYTYTPAANYNGTDMVVINVCDAGNPMPAACVNDTIFITVNAVNDPITIVNDVKTTNEDTPVAGAIITAGDFDTDTTAITVNTTPVSGPSHGGFVINAAGAYTYTPAAGFNGTDVIILNVCDAGRPMPATCANDTLVITVTAINDPPVMTNENISMNEDNPFSGNATSNDSDPDSTSLTANTTPVAGPSHGGFVIAANGAYTYTPNANYNGTDMVVINVCDAGNPMPAACVNDTIFITVNPVNDPITIVNDVKTTNEDTPVAGTIITAGDFDTDTTALTVNTTPVSGPSHGGFVINAAGAYTYTPAAGFNGTDIIILNVCDAGRPMPATCANDTLVITVTAINDPPVMTNENISMNEDNPFSGNATSNDNDPDSTTLTANTTPVTGPSHGGFVIAANGAYTYTPAANYNGTDMVVINVCDAGNPMPAACVNDTIFITVNPVNDPITIVNDVKTTNEDTPVGGTIITAGDFDTDTTALTVNTTPVSGPSHGGFVINAAGAYTYTPAAGFNGTDVIILNVCDAGRPMPATCANDTLVITVIAINDPPVMTNENISTNEDTPFSNNAISNDNDPDSTTLTVNTTPVVNASHGGFVIAANGAYTYTPNTNYNGTDMIVVNVCDAGNPLPAACVNDTIFITVNPVNDPVVITNDNTTSNEDTPSSGTIITAGDFDPDTTTLVVNTTPVSGPNNGGFVIDNTGNYTYTPDPGFNGTDTIIISVCDGGTPMPVTCANDTLIFTVTAINDAPVMTNENISTNEDTPFSNNAISNDNDPDSTTLTVNTTPVVNASNGTFVIAANGAYTYTPDADFNGVDMVVVNVCDAGTPLPIICLNDTIFITVNPINDPIVLVSDTISVLEDSTAIGSILNAQDYDPDTTALVVNTTPLSGPSNGIILIDNAGNYTYTPNTGFNGWEQIVIQVCDGGTPAPPSCDNDTLNIWIGPVNTAPVTVSQGAVTLEDQNVTGNAIGNDFDPDSTTVWANPTVITGPAHGIFNIALDGTYSYTPALNYNGSDYVIIAVCDSGIPMPPMCTNDTIFFTINPVNDTSILVNDVNVTNEETPVNGNIITAGDIDPDTTTLVVNTTPLTGPSNGLFVIDNAGNYTYTPNTGFNGIDIIVLQVCDSGTPLPAICGSDTLVITVDPVNDAPVTANDTAEVDEDLVLIGSVINGFDSDPDSTTLSADTVPVSGPSHGTIQINPNGSYTYTPDPDFNGTDVVIISICDSGTPLPSLCTNDTLTITVHPINDAPVTADDVNSTPEDTPVNGNILTAGDFDPDTTALTVNPVVVSGPANGIFVIDTLGNYTYTPNANFNGTDVIVISICDWGTPMPTACTNETLVITVTPVNDNLVVVNDIASTLEGQPATGTVITGGDFDPDTTTLTANPFIINGPYHGTILVNSNGTYTYTPGLFYNGSDTVVIQVCDGGTPLPATCANDTLFIIVFPYNNAPVISNDAISINEDTPISGTVLTGTDYDPDTTILTATTIPVSGPSHGIIVIQSDGSYTYTPDTNYFGTDTVIISICDAGNPIPVLCVNDTLIITINPVNDNPIVANENTNTCAGSPLQVSVLLNDSDIEGDSLIVTSVNQPSNGLATTDGITVTYTPAPGFFGIDSLLYTVCDNGSPVRCSNAKIYIDVHGITSTGIAATDALCNGDSSGSVSTNPVGIAPFTYSWNTGATTQNITNVPAGTYTVTVTDSVGCSTVSSATVNQPATSVQANTSATDASCFNGSNGTATVNATGGTGAYTYLWSTTDTTQSISGLAANTYTVTVTDANGCASAVTTAVVSQPTAPVSITASTIPANCLNGTTGSVDITPAGGTPGYSFGWSNSAITEDISDVAGNYFVTVTDLNGCTDTATFIITDASAVTISTSTGSNTICQGDSVMLSSSATGGTYQWNFNGSPIAGATGSTYYASLAGSYTLDQTNICGSFTSAVLVITVTPMPVISVSGNMMICEGSSTQMTATGGTTYSWTPAADLDNPASATPIANPIVTTIYTVTGTLGSCSGIATATLTVNPSPVLVVTQTPHDCKLGTQITVTGANGYMWSPPNGLDQINIPNPIAKPYETTTYTVTASSSNSCVATATVTVIVDCDDIKIPSGFSPDGDGVNDKFVIADLDFFESPNIIIFNRWGNIVFSMNDYDNSWDGTNKSDNFSLGDGKVPDGTYFYVLQLTPSLVKTGYIVIKY